MWLVFEGSCQLWWLRLNGTLLFEKKDTTEKANKAHLRLQIGRHLIADKNVLEAMLVPETQITEGSLAHVAESSLHVIPIEVYLEIKEGNTTE